MANRKHILIDDIPDGDVITTTNESFDDMIRTSSGSYLRADHTDPVAAGVGSFLFDNLSNENVDVRDFLPDIYVGSSFYLWVPAKPAIKKTISQIRTLTVGAFSGRSELDVMVLPDATTTVTAGGGTDLAAGAFLAGTGVLTVDNTNTMHFKSTNGTISVPTSGGTTVLSYGTKTTTTFQNCQWISGSGTVSNGATVTQEASLRLGSPVGTIFVSLPYAVAAWQRIEYFAKMGTTTANGEIYFGHYTLGAPTTPVSFYQSLTANVGIQAERVQYESVAYGACSPLVADTTGIKLAYINTLSGSSIGALGTHGWVDDVVPPPDPDPDPDPPPTQNNNRLVPHRFDGTNLVQPTERYVCG